MKKPSEIWDTPEATGFDRVAGITTPRIEETAKAIKEKVGLDDIQTANVVVALTEAYQAGIDEAVGIVNALRDDPRGSSCLDCMDWEMALDETIKALQSKK